MKLPRRNLRFRPLQRSTLLLLAVALAAGCGARERSGSAEPIAAAGTPPRPDILLLTVDTLRADHLSAWGYPRPTSPVLDRLAGEGVRFELAQAQWPKTAPSFASLFTATYPKDNGIVRRVGMPIDCRLRMLAEELKALGYQTHAVVGNGAVGREFYFDQGFDSYEEAWKATPPDGRSPTAARSITDLALARLDRLEPGKPTFLWVHYIDPHSPYRPEGEHRDLFQGDGHFRPGTEVKVERRTHRKFIGGIGRSQVIDDATDLAFYVARYDAEIRYADTEIGRLVSGLEQRGLWDRMLTVMTSDHGESLGEHDYFFGHGMLGFQTCLHVPLALRYPGVLEPRVDPHPVELLNVAPTILDFAGAPLDQGRWGQGSSLRRRLLGESSGAGTVAFSEAGYATEGNWIRTAFDGRFKLTFVPWRSDQRKVAGEGVRFILYDLEADPAETVNVAESRPADLDRLRRDLWAWDRAPRFPARTDPDSCGQDRAVDERTEEQLRALGYL